MLCATYLTLNGQTRTISGHIITEDYKSLPMATIYSIDTIEIAKADIDGNFKFDLPTGTKKLLVGYLGMEWTNIELKKGCSSIDIIMMYNVIYDFISLKRIHRKRLRRFKLLPEIHQKAYEKGIFSTPLPCYKMEFEEFKSRKSN